MVTRISHLLSTLLWQVRIDDHVFKVSAKAKHEMSASSVTLDRKVRSQLLYDFRSYAFVKGVVLP